MKVQRVRIPDTDKVSWLVLGDDFLPVQPIQLFLQYLENLEKSPNTVRAYTSHLKLYWEYLTSSQLDWTHIRLSELAGFVAWLRDPQPGVIALQEQEARRSESTINAILAAVASFYDFHQHNGTVGDLPLYREQMQPGRRYKGFLYHITKGKSTRNRRIKLRQHRRIPQTLTEEQFEQLVAACRRLRDKFLLHLLYHTGMRIGQALGLRLEDIRSWDNEIHVVPRTTNANSMRAKAQEPNTIHVGEDLMALYADYLVYEFGETDSDYVFVNLWDGEIGQPMTYSAVTDLFHRLHKKTGIRIHPHMLRHTHATELIRDGWDAAKVQKRLGHASVQTTLNIYTHLNDEDLKQAHHAFIQRRKGSSNAE
jgi:integrase/recombinase XerD